MPQDLIRYDLIVQDALKGVVRKVLTDAATQGMPGEHHFYISFRTQDAGVRISQRLRDKYPDEMTIVLQHQFWDLVVTEHSFEVGLSFSGIPERLLVPFDSLTGFFDPSVQFGLKFEVSATDPADNDEGGPEAFEDDEEPAAPIPLGTPARKPAEPARKATTAVEPAAKPAKAEKAEGEPRKNAKAKSEATKSEAAKADAAKQEPPAKAETRGDGAEVVSLDAFRKKT
jgi:hypothetical protein